MNYWDSVGRWINTLLVFIVGILAFDALFRLLEANEDNVIVSFVRVLSVVFLVPFQGMFGEQDYLLTTLVGVLGYALLAGIALGVLRSLQASLAQPAPPVAPDASQPQSGAAELPATTTASDTPQPAASDKPAPAAPATPEPKETEDRSPRRLLPGRASRESRRPRSAPSAAPATSHERQESRKGNGAAPDPRTPARDAREQPERRRSRDRTRDRAATRRPASPTASSDKRG